MAKPRKKKRIPAIILAVMLLNLLADIIITKAVYDSIFPRYDCSCNELCSVSCEDVNKVSFFSGENELSGALYDTEGESLVVISQGMNSCMGNFVPQIEAFIENGFDVFIFDMTGSGDSDGESAVGFSQSVYDLNAALDYIDGEYGYENIFVFGHSRGGSAACLVLTERDDVDAVVAVCSPNSAMETVIYHGSEIMGFIAYGNYPMLWMYQSLLFDAKTVSATCSEAVDKSEVPVLVVHGRDDETVPIDGYSVISHKDEIESESVEYLILEGGHSSVMYDESGQGANGELMARVTEFFENNEERGGE